MWGTVEDRPEAVAEAIKFTGDAALYGSFMRRVIQEWPISCENALTDASINRKAWVGHAACALALRIPEDVVREAWGKLSNEQRRLANAQAEYAIAAWEQHHKESAALHRDLGKQMLFEWDSR